MLEECSLGYFTSIKPNIPVSEFEQLH